MNAVVWAIAIAATLKVSDAQIMTTPDQDTQVCLDGLQNCADRYTEEVLSKETLEYYSDCLTNVRCQTSEGQIRKTQFQTFVKQNLDEYNYEPSASTSVCLSSALFVTSLLATLRWYSN